MKKSRLGKMYRSQILGLGLMGSFIGFRFKRKNDISNVISEPELKQERVDAVFPGEYYYANGTYPETAQRVIDALENTLDEIVLNQKAKLNPNEPISHEFGHAFINRNIPTAESLHEYGFPTQEDEEELKRRTYQILGEAYSISRTEARSIMNDPNTIPMTQNKDGVWEMKR